MDNKDREQIEDILEKSAKRIEMKPFADRWKDIESRLEFDRTEKVVIKDQIPVLAMQSNTNTNESRKTFNKYKIFGLSICLFLIIFLSIFIPISLRKSEPVYFGPNDLISEFVAEDVFFDEIENSKIDIVDLSKYYCEELTLLKSLSGEVQGGKFSLNDEEGLYLVYVSFYSNSVIVPEDDFSESEKYELANTEIFYIRTDDSELIEYKVLAKHNNVTYELNYLALSDNLIAFFNEFFS
ncbi:MAG: hypothetical protein HFE32_00395 [Clostridia bacterium]|jgi:hypothetical protein|nr:hypothetical protein [Clostridia bacterium]